MLRLLLLAAVPPPAPPGHAWASPFTEFLWQVEEGPSSAKRWTALPREPRREAKTGPEAGRRHGPLEDGPPRTEHPERTNPAVEQSHTPTAPQVWSGRGRAANGCGR